MTIYNKQLNADFFSMVEKDEDILKEQGLVQTGDRIVVSAGVPHALPGKTNIMKLHMIGER